MAAFGFQGMIIQRLVAHTVFARGQDKQLIEPDYSDELVELEQEAIDLIQLRITNALGSASHGVEMAIEGTGAGSFFQRGASMIRSQNPEFLSGSKELAYELAKAQINPRWPGGVLIVISGRVGQQSKPFVAVIKAETDKGFNVVKEEGRTKLQLIKKMLLSETQRLYKVGILIEMNTAQPDAEGKFDQANYKAFLFDHLLTATETKPAAAYFYSSFLGLSILASSRRQTQVFYEEGRNFINTADVPDEDRYTYREALRTEMRSNTPTLSATEFAEQYLPEELRQSFIDHLVSKGFPEQAVVKDTEYIKTKLRRPRNVTFTSGVLIKVPADQNFQELVDIAVAEDGFTQVKIKGTVQDHD